MEKVPRDFERYLDATVASSNRIRQVIIVLVTASVVMTVATWNAWDLTSWFLFRKDSISRAIHWHNMQKSPEESSRHSEYLAKLALGNREAQTEREEIQTQDEAAKRLEKRMYATMSDEQISQLAMKWRDQSYDNVNIVKLPFFGVVIDANDVPLFGGFALLVILVWLRLSLWRHYINLNAVFSNTNTDLLGFGYQYLSMAQVLNIPRSLEEKDTPTRPASRWIDGLIFLPVVAQVIGLASDFMTLKVLVPFDAVGHGVILTMLGIIWLPFMLYMAIKCLTLRHYLEAVWQGAFEQLTRLSAKTAGQPAQPGETP
ncbi:MAG TPA: hypothetical protein VN782_02840 [Usitatibacter sp.]|nr:hypothetical protein [Usitatibacter sp.]